MSGRLSLRLTLRRAVSSLLFLLLVSLSACDAEAILNSPEQMWLWLLAPLGFFVIFGTFFVSWRRGRQMRHWNLGSNPTEPSTQSTWLAILIFAILVTVVFVIYNFVVDIDDRQRLWNIGLWFVGTLLGLVLALLLGFRLGEPGGMSTESGKGA